MHRFPRNLRGFVATGSLVSALAPTALADTQGGVPYAIPYTMDTKAIPFVEFGLQEMVDPTDPNPVGANESLWVVVNNKPVRVRAKDLVTKLNGVERRLSEVGRSLRDTDKTLAIHNFPNPELWAREMQSRTGMNLDALVDNLQLRKENCPTLKLGDLGVNLQTGTAWSANDLVKIPGQGAVRVSDLLPKLNTEQASLCGMGLSLVGGLVPGSSAYLADLLANRVQVFKGLKIDSSSALYEVAKWAQGTSVTDVRREFDAIADAINSPSPEKLYTLAQRGAGALDPALVLPNLPALTSPGVTKRVDLALQKHYNWGGLHGGDAKFASYDAAMWAELRSGKAATADSSVIDEQALQGEASFTLHVLTYPIEVGKTTIDSSLKPTAGFAKLTYCFFGQCTTKEASKTDIGITEGDPRAFADNWQEQYSQQLQVGPVPVVVRARANAALEAGWKVALTPISVSGGIIGTANSAVTGEAAIGVDGFVEAGCGGTVTLLNDTLTINGEAKVKFLADNQPIIEGTLTGDNDISAFDGRIYGYALIDVMAGFGDTLDRVIDAMKELGDGDLRDFVNRVGATSAIGKKLIKNLEGSGRKLASEWHNAVDHATDALDDCCRLPSVPHIGRVHFAAPTLLGATPYGFTVNGTKLRYEFELINWPALVDHKRFLNYTMYIGPDGKEYGGDLASYGDHGVAGDNIDEENILLTAREDKASQVEAALKGQKIQVLLGIEEFLNADSSRALNGMVRSLASQRQQQVGQVKAALAPFRSMQ